MARRAGLRRHRLERGLRLRRRRSLVLVEPERLVGQRRRRRRRWPDVVAVLDRSGRPDAELVGERQHAVLRRPDPLTAELDDRAVCERVVQDAPADAVAGLQHDDLVPARWRPRAAVRPASPAPTTTTSVFSTLTTARRRGCRARPYALAARSRSASTRRRILPDGDFGMASITSSSRIRLCGATRDATYSMSSSGATAPDSTTKPLGASLARSSGTPMTQASATAG